MDSDKRSGRLYKQIMLVVLSVLITYIVTSALIYQRIGEGGNTKYVIVPNQNSELSSELSSIRTIIDRYYLGEVNDEMVDI